MGIVYASYILFRFTFGGHWYPLVIPLFFQPVLAFIGTAAWKYADIRKDRQDIRRALGYYLPDNLADQLVKNISKTRRPGRSFTAPVFPQMPDNILPCPRLWIPTLHTFMNQYYKILFEQVKRHKGIVINVVGDAMLAIWAKKLFG